MNGCDCKRTSCPKQTKDQSSLECEDFELWRTCLRQRDEYK